ncbi:MAG: EF-P lysine aminoacylase EpmA [Pseudomonadales bacterium]|jgi:lysyl-tRNA synthetase class 2
MTTWRSGASPGVLAARSELLHAIRGYFYQQDVIEVETPTLGSRGVSDLHIENIQFVHQGRAHFLQTSPEYAMKRLLASGSGSIYQICPAYRGREIGRRHNIEFTMLEWYRVGYSISELMDDTQALLSAVAETVEAQQFNFAEMPRVSYRYLFLERFGINPHQTSIEQLADLARAAELDCSHIQNYNDDASLGDYLDLLFSASIEPQLEKPTIVYNFPACQVALAQLGMEDDCIVAKRFEVFVAGIELANGYLELNDGQELEGRMKVNNEQRKIRGLGNIEADAKLLSALAHMPPCSGIAMGLDRLLMILLATDNLAEVLSFTSDNI